VRHLRFHQLGEALRPGDLLVVNTSATLPAAVDGERAGDPVTVHFSTPGPRGRWVVEVRRPDGLGPLAGASVGDRLRLPGRAALRLERAHPDPRAGSGSRLWTARLTTGRPGLTRAAQVEPYLAAHGRPVRYGYLRDRWPLSAYQTVFAREPGSAEMPSAGRPFSTGLVTRLVADGVLLAPVLLHTGVSSLESGEAPLRERFRVPEGTARLVESVRARGGRVVAVGTTVARALETVAGPDGSVRAGAGWTDLVLGPDRPSRVLDGIVTGLHAPEASHLLLLEAVAGAPVVERAYAAALADGYRWHEFGDSTLLFHDRERSRARWPQTSSRS
jgi:S-adenosylmethionine:tRNA ribosyltransferase-isomerase